MIECYKNNDICFYNNMCINYAIHVVTKEKWSSMNISILCFDVRDCVFYALYQVSVIYFLTFGFTYFYKYKHHFV